MLRAGKVTLLGAQAALQEDLGQFPEATQCLTMVWATDSELYRLILASADMW